MSDVELCRCESRYKPENTVKAKFDITFQFAPLAEQDGLSAPLTQIFLRKKDAGDPMETGDDDKGYPIGPNNERYCVHTFISKDQNTMHISSLYYKVEKSVRMECGVKITSSHMGRDALSTATEPATEPTIEPTYIFEKRKAPNTEGPILLSAMCQIAAALDMNTVTLEDGAKYASTSNAPFLGEYVSDYLRLIRGFGQYEAAGFFAKEPDTPYNPTDEEKQQEAQTEQRALDEIDLIMSTPLEQIQAKLQEDAVDLLPYTDGYKQDRLFEELEGLESLSMRDIVKKFEEDVKPLCPKGAENYNDMKATWQSKVYKNRSYWRERVRSEMRSQGKNDKEIYDYEVNDEADIRLGEYVRSKEFEKDRKVWGPAKWIYDNLGGILPPDPSLAADTDARGNIKYVNLYKRFFVKDGKVHHWVIRLATGEKSNSGDKQINPKPIVEEKELQFQFFFRPWKAP